MDGDVFEQLDALNSRVAHQAAEIRPQHISQHSLVDFDSRFATESYSNTYSPHNALHSRAEFPYEDPMVLDDFDRQLLRQHSTITHQDRSSSGYFPIRRPVNPTHAYDSVSHLRQHIERRDEPQHAYQQPSTSPLPSSPLVNAYNRQCSSLITSSSAALAHQRAPAPDDALVSGLQIGQASSQSIPLQPRSTHDNQPPVVQGIPLVSTRRLPDRFRTVFPFPLFNAVQSKSFEIAYQTNDNYVLSAPTGSGKTAVFELAICRLANLLRDDLFKIVYQAPIKALCAERQRDWQAKFGPMGLQCAELTGDTDTSQLTSVKNASIIITTPEKWDSVTRKWKDHQKLMHLIKLFLVDEVHILKDERGATLEAVVSRMKSVATGVRFIALSATVPNAHDIAVWLGKSSEEPHSPAVQQHFGEAFRPVRLARHVCGYKIQSNDFQFDNALTSKLMTDVIPRWSQRKPILIFCFTKRSCLQTAQALAKWWTESAANKRHWDAPLAQPKVADLKLRAVLTCGVAFHNTDLSADDRLKVETAYLNRQIGVICSTSTLAVGINLPCHMVVVKGTMCWQSGSIKPYSDLEIMQMLGRAGRPQFEQSAIAVIMTRSNQVDHYENIIAGKELIESCLHRNLVEHLNAEIGLGTITDSMTAKRWLTGTFLYVRLKANPNHYWLENGMSGDTLDERLSDLCTRSFGALEEHRLIESSPRLHCTELGDAMTRYCVRFETMQTFLAIPHAAKASEILSSVAQASEFRDVRFKSGEKLVYRNLNKDSSIKFPIPVQVDATWHKVSLIIQSVLGMVDLPQSENASRSEYQTAKYTVFQRIHRLIRCIIDCKLFLDDAVSVRRALMLARSFGSEAWDDSPVYLRQLPNVGPVLLRKLAGAGIRSVDDIDCTETAKLEALALRNPPFGTHLQKAAREFPRLHVSIAVDVHTCRATETGVNVSLKAEVGFLNEGAPSTFNRKAIHVCLLAEISDGRKAHFARISAKQLSRSQEVRFAALMTDPGQTVRVYVMCEDIAGTAIHAQVKPDLPLRNFSTIIRTKSQIEGPRTVSKMAASLGVVEDDYGDALDDEDLAKAANDVEFIDIDDIAPQELSASSRLWSAARQTQDTPRAEPLQLANGKWPCNHQCKDKTKCKHLCCREGVEKKQKPKKKDVPEQTGVRQTQLPNMTAVRNRQLPTPSISDARNDRSSRLTNDSVRGQSFSASGTVLGKHRLDASSSVSHKRTQPATDSQTARQALPISTTQRHWGHESDDDFELVSPSRWLANKEQPTDREFHTFGISVSQGLDAEKWPESTKRVTPDGVGSLDFDFDYGDDMEVLDMQSPRAVGARQPLAPLSTNSSILSSAGATQRNCPATSTKPLTKTDEEEDVDAILQAEDGARAQPVDPLREWFEREFGTENFNFVG